MKQIKKGDLVKFRPNGSYELCFGLVMRSEKLIYGSRHSSHTRTISELTVMSQGKIVKVYEPRADLL